MTTKPQWPSVEYWDERIRKDEIRFQQQMGWLPKPQYVMGVACEIVDIDIEKTHEIEQKKKWVDDAW